MEPHTQTTFFSGALQSARYDRLLNVLSSLSQPQLKLLTPDCPTDFLLHEYLPCPDSPVLVSSAQHLLFTATAQERPQGPPRACHCTYSCSRELCESPFQFRRFCIPPEILNISGLAKVGPLKDIVKIFHNQAHTSDSRRK